MPRKLVTWLGWLIIVAAGTFCCIALLNYRDAFEVVDTTYKLLTIGAFVAPLVAVVTIFLWYYFNEKH